MSILPIPSGDQAVTTQRIVLGARNARPAVRVRASRRPPAESPTILPGLPTSYDYRPQATATSPTAPREVSTAAAVLASSTPDLPGRYSIQVGAFESKGAAVDLATAVAAIANVSAYVVLITGDNGAQAYRVLVGASDRRGGLRRAEQTLNRAGHSGSFVRDTWDGTGITRQAVTVTVDAQGTVTENRVVRPHFGKAGEVGKFSVQVASLSSLRDADELARELSGVVGVAYRVDKITTVQGKDYYRVFLGQFDHPADAQYLVTQLQGRGFETPFARHRNDIMGLRSVSTVRQGGQAASSAASGRGQDLSQLGAARAAFDLHSTTIQVGVFTDYGVAIREAEALRQAYDEPVALFRLPSGSHRIVVGAFPAYDDAVALSRRLSSDGRSGWVRKIAPSDAVIFAAGFSEAPAPMPQPPDSPGEIVPLVGQFGTQVGVFSTRETATTERRRAELVLRTTVYIVPTGTAFRLIAGNQSAEDAFLLAAIAGAHGFFGAFPREWDENLVAAFVSGVVQAPRPPLQIPPPVVAAPPVTPDIPSSVPGVDAPFYRTPRPGEVTALLQEAHQAKSEGRWADAKYLLLSSLELGTPVQGIFDQVAILDRLMTSSFTLPTDPLFAHQWSLKNNGRVVDVNWPLKKGSDGKVVDAWTTMGSRGSRKVNLAVIDNGIDLQHHEFRGKVSGTYDVWSGSPVIQPANASFTHGTPCASIAVAAADGKGMVGVSDASLVAISGTSFGLGDTETMFSKAVELDADIISCSWGTTDASFRPNAAKEEAISKAARVGRDGKGSIILYAAGGDSLDFVNFYGVMDDVICVGAATSKGEAATYSNQGPELWVVAPSNGDWPVVAARASWDEGLSWETGAYKYWRDGKHRGGDHKHFGGNSFATPFVAGVVALMLSENPTLTAKQVKKILAQTADKIGDPKLYDTRGWSKEFGYGQVDAEKAVKEARRQLKAYQVAPLPVSAVYFP